MPRPNRRPTTAEDIEARFERGRFVARALAGRYTCCLKDQCPAAAPTEPAGTRTAVIEFHDEHGNFAFLVHFYLRPDGSIGASRLLDPKVLADDDGIEYYVP